jgi:hypothetical protein
MTKYYSLYIRHNFVFFVQVTMKVIFYGKYNTRVQYLIIFDFKKSLIFLNFFWIIFYFFQVWGCVAPESQKSVLLHIVLMCNILPTEMHLSDCDFSMIII